MMCDVNKRGWKVGGGRLLLVAALGVVGACSEQLVGQVPPTEKLYFPVNMEVSHQRYVYILNSNFDQRYNAGWISVVDLQELDQNPWLSQLNVLSLGGDLALDPGLDGDPRKLMVTHRGAGVVTEVDLDFSGGEPALTCGDPESEKKRVFAEEQTDCAASRMIHLADSLGEISLSPEQVRDPYGITFFEGTEGLSLGLGFLNLDQIFSFEIDSESPVWLGTPTAVDLDATPGTGTESLIPMPAQPGVLLATGRGRASIYSLDLEFETGEDPFAAAFGVEPGAELVDLVFSSDDPTVAYVVTNRPGAVLSLKVSEEGAEVLEADGTWVREERPTFRVLSAIPLAGRPAGLARLAGDAGELLFVTGFENDEVFVIRAEGSALRVVRRLSAEDLDPGNSGRLGPFAVAAVDCSKWEGKASGCGRLVVGNFLGESATVLDVSGTDVDGFKQIAVIK